MTRIGTVINFCSLDKRFIGPCIDAVAPVSTRVVVPYADHLFDNTPENMAVIERVQRENPAARFVTFKYHHDMTEMLRSRFWHNYARWVGFSHIPEDCDWVLFLDADEIVETHRFQAFLEKGGFDIYDHLYFANYWYFREPRYRARQIEDSPVMVKREMITVNRMLHENERATFRRLPNGLRRVAGADGKPMFHHYSWVMTQAEMLRKIRTWGHSRDTDRDWEALVKKEFSSEFSGKDFVHGYDFDVVEPLIETEMDAPLPEEAEEFVVPDRDRIAAMDLSPLSRFVAQTDDLAYFLDTDFQEHYRLLAYLGTLFSGQTLFDIGTYRGYSALALSYNTANRVVSYDIEECKRLHDREELDHIEFVLGDVLEDPRLLEAPLILVDIAHDGVWEQRIYDFLHQKNYKGVVVFDDIHLNPAMEGFWNNICRPKQDITDRGHVTGTGMVFFGSSHETPDAGITVTAPDTPSSRDSKTSVAGLRIGFHSNQLGLRGTDVALYDYAYFNREILGNESIIISDAGGDMAGLEKFQREFEVLLYDDFVQVERFVEEKGIDAVYYQKAGKYDGKLVANARNLVHAVFQSCEPHGDVYAYISRWLADEAGGGRHPFVPYIVRMPDIDGDFRKQLGIPDGAVVFGRHGGRDQFDIPYAREVVHRVAKAKPDIVFLFMNTERFCEPLDNIIHLNPTWDMAAKAVFINTCDAMLHARIQGETFGLAIAEFLMRDKPVIACGDGVDKNHLDMLGNLGMFYHNPLELFDLLMGFERVASRGQYRERVAPFSPRRVMERFRDVFLAA
jgi:predicted O-methyltransferase YrrM